MRLNLSTNIQINDEVGIMILEEVFERALFEIWNLAKIYVPVDTGNLRASIQILQVSKREIIIQVMAPYGKYIEFGTYRMRPQPYLRPAIDEVRFVKIKNITNQVFDKYKYLYK